MELCLPTESHIVKENQCSMSETSFHSAQPQQSLQLLLWTEIRRPSPHPAWPLLSALGCAAAERSACTAVLLGSVSTREAV